MRKIIVEFEFDNSEWDDEDKETSDELLIEDLMSETDGVGYRIVDPNEILHAFIDWHNTYKEDRVMEYISNSEIGKFNLEKK